MIGAIATATEMQNNFGKYLNMVINGNEVIVTKNGKEIGRFIPKDSAVSSLTFANLIYMMRKELDPNKIENVLQQLKLIFQLTDLSVTDITKAANLKWDDFEDAIQSAIAERIHADYIITRNVRDFNKSRITAFTPEEYLSRI